MSPSYWTTSMWVLAGVNLAVGLFHLAIGLRSEAGYRRAANAWFGVGALAYFGVIVLSVGIYVAREAAHALDLYRLTLHAFLLYGLCLYGLVGASARRPQARILAAAGVGVLPLFVANQWSTATLAFSGVPELVSIELPWGERLSGLTGPPSLWLVPGAVFVLGSVPYAWYVIRSASDVPLRRQARLVALAITIFGAGLALDVGLVATGHAWAPSSDISHTALILVLSYGLGAELLAAREVQRRLTEAEVRFQELVEHSPSAIFVKNLDGAYTSVNRRFLQLVGLSAAEILGFRADEISSPAAQPTATTSDQDVLHSGRPTFYEAEIQTSEGKRWMRIVKFPLRGPEGEIYAIGGIATDLTDHKQAEREIEESRDRLSRLAAELSATEERERHEIATYLHDHIGQSLAVLRMKLDRLERRPANDARGHIAEIRRLVDEMIASTRTVTFDLSPPMLYELGLAPALDWLVESTCAPNGLRGEFQTAAQSEMLSDEAKVLLFRSASELLANVLKHAGAERVLVVLEHSDSDVRLTVEDDGCGIQAGALEPGRGYGLFSIRERLRIVGGSVEIESQPDRGTKVAVSLPLSAVGLRQDSTGALQ